MRLAALLAWAAGIAGASGEVEVFGRKWTVPAAGDWSLSRDDGVWVG